MKQVFTVAFPVLVEQLAAPGQLRWCEEDKGQVWNTCHIGEAIEEPEDFVNSVAAPLAPLWLCERSFDGHGQGGVSGAAETPSRVSRFRTQSYHRLHIVATMDYPGLELVQSLGGRAAAPNSFSTPYPCRITLHLLLCDPIPGTRSQPITYHRENLQRTLH
ncbi:hypothetical protein Bbelb_041140 [Branchiostoma belcheri]|nr:hypothetical protein Bbelb_041140 [Branchiostoma belcheri]